MKRDAEQRAEDERNAAEWVEVQRLDGDAGDLGRDDDREPSPRLKLGLDHQEKRSG